MADSHKNYKYEPMRYTQRKKISNCANRFLFSKAYTALLVLLIVINLALLAWELIIVIPGKNYPDHWLFLFGEILVNVALLADILLRVTAQQKKYFSSWSNAFDCFVLLFSVGSMVIYFHGTKIVQEFEDVTVAILLALRYLVVLFRVISIIKNQRNKMLSENRRVDFTNIAPPLIAENTSINADPHASLQEAVFHVDEEEQDDYDY